MMNSRRAASCRPRRKMPCTVGIRGSAQPSTYPNSNQHVALVHRNAAPASKIGKHQTIIECCVLVLIQIQMLASPAGSALQGGARKAM